jgi:lysophospholipase L1-like esterase
MSYDRLIAVLFAITASLHVCAADDAKPETAVGVPKTGDWPKRHEKYLRWAKENKDTSLLFLGDSITEQWSEAGKEVWAKYYAPRKALNFGISADRTQHLLWRVQNGELDGLSPKVVVLLIGINNSWAKKAEREQRINDIATGTQAIIDTVRDKCPKSKILVLGIFPVGDGPDPVPVGVNKIVATQDDKSTIRYLDIGDKFLGADGKVPAEIMPDKLHLSAKGYQIWSESMEPLLKEMLEE